MFRLTWGDGEIELGNQKFPTVDAVRGFLEFETDLTPEMVEKLIATGKSGEDNGAWILFGKVVVEERRKYVDGCSLCESVRKNNGFGPSHDASNSCESGKHSHCTCDTCF